MRRIGLTVGATYKSPNGDIYEVLGTLSCERNHNDVPEFYYFAIKNGEKYSAVPMSADYSEWELCIGKKE